MTKTHDPSTFPGPLNGLRVLDLSTVYAGPFAATMLGDLGADVLKVELPGTGDSLRSLPPYKEEIPLWWKVTNRNKRGITIDLHRKEGLQLLARLLPHYDVLVENFRPGKLDSWGITKSWMHDIQPKLTILRVTGFGQTGPYSHRPGFARVFEAMTGFTNICGEADGPPLHLGFPIADAVAGLFGALGVLAALYQRHAGGSLKGEEIDCSLMESMFRIMEFLPIEYDQLGIVRQRSGSFSQYAAPGNIYMTRDGKWASIAASTQSIFERLCRALDRADMIIDERFLNNPLRVANRQDLDALVRDEIAKYSVDELSVMLDDNEVGFSPIYNIADIFNDPHFAARQALVEVLDDELGKVRMQNVAPVFNNSPGAVRSAGPSIGQHNDEVLEELGLSHKEIAALKEAGVI
ncbi:CaiB/BaiF CoA transferase family protein [Pollutimonas harenae]|uniref:CoA transferase n=1 Tax=Pollutimonas harenae TaxID=657015 RepID=A0A853GZH3_9BURK|nr:CoA transferase [Pollutimonas harenae]NYT84809.1 CoA transferase [Pollutimonas harenae]TEA72792.1 CoA transferase [Pollutimonas harenae]